MIYTPIEFNEKKFSNGIKTVLSSYSQAINNKYRRTGSIFQQNTKAKCLSLPIIDNRSSYAHNCFNYIHQNPVRKYFVKKLEDWEFSSFREYVRLKDYKYCDIELAKLLLDLPEKENDFYDISYELVDFKRIEKYF